MVLGARHVTRAFGRRGQIFYVTQKKNGLLLVKLISVIDLPERVKAVFVAVVGVAEKTLASRIDIEQFSKLELLKSTTAIVLKLCQKYRSVEQNPKADHMQVT